MRAVKERVLDYKNAFKVCVASGLFDANTQRSMEDIVEHFRVFQDGIDDALYLINLNHNLEALALRSIDYGDVRNHLLLFRDYRVRKAISLCDSRRHR
jgi:hypothetical protein